MRSLPPPKFNQWQLSYVISSAMLHAQSFHFLSSNYRVTLRWSTCGQLNVLFFDMMPVATNKWNRSKIPTCCTCMKICVSVLCVTHFFRGVEVIFSPYFHILFHGTLSWDLYRTYICAHCRWYIHFLLLPELFMCLERRYVNRDIRWWWCFLLVVLGGTSVPWKSLCKQD